MSELKSSVGVQTQRKNRVFRAEQFTTFSLSAIEHWSLQSNSRRPPYTQFPGHFYRKTSRAKWVSHLTANNNRVVMKSQRSLRDLAPACNEGGVRGVSEKISFWTRGALSLNCHLRNVQEWKGTFWTRQLEKKSRKTVYYDGRIFISSVGPWIRETPIHLERSAGMENFTSKTTCTKSYGVGFLFPQVTFISREKTLKHEHFQRLCEEITGTEDIRLTRCWNCHLIVMCLCVCWRGVV